MTSLRKRIVFGIFFLVGCCVFYGNFRVADKDFFRTFQWDSEALVIGKIFSEKYGVPMATNLGFIRRSQDQSSSDFYAGVLSSDSFEHVMERESVIPGEFVTAGYVSQVGLQGKIFTFLFNTLNLKSIKIFYIFNAVALSLALLLIAWEYENIVPRLGMCFAVATIFSPWVVSFARNLYWVPFTWYLPALFSLYYYKYIHSCKGKWICAGCIFAAFFIKSLCGYEYLSSIILLAAMPFALSVFMEPSRLSRIACVKYFSIVCGLGCLGFLCALLLHANMRGDTVLHGLANIFEQDVLRRTYGDPSAFSPPHRASLTASPLTVVGMYIFQWKTRVLAFVPGLFGAAFFLVCLLPSLGALLWEKRMRDRLLTRNLFFLFYAASIPLSWFILGKAHSYIHTHMNFVLWYMGFIPVCLFLLTDVCVRYPVFKTQFFQAARTSLRAFGEAAGVIATVWKNAGGSGKK